MKKGSIIKIVPRGFDGQYYWILCASNGHRIAQSAKNYPSRDRCRASAENAIKIIQKTEVFNLQHFTSSLDVPS